jgi:glutaminyl-peptide cyclotransferase
VKQVVAMGPRPVGSAAHSKLEDYLRAHLKSDRLEEDAFTAATPAGDLRMRNYIAKFPGTKDGIIVVAGHYDTLYGRKDFVGANDGGSSTGLPLALADVLRARKKLSGYSVWTVLTDGEEAIRQWSQTDSVYGARHLAAKWKQDGTAKRIKALLVVDMIGDADLNIDRDQYSTPWLEDLVYAAATRLGYQSHFFGRTLPIEDDHLPFRDAGIPVADLIDLNYGYNNVFWHTPEDTLDKLSPQSLAIAGDTVLETIRLVDARK